MSSAGQNSAVRNLRSINAKDSSQVLPPKRPLSGTRPSVGFDSCCFCGEVKGKKNLPYELTTNQVIKLYDYYALNPANLLLLPASSEK